jgi:multicomponent Na+:H+ antiporter subunit E
MTILRAAALFGFWLLLTGADLGDLAAGGVAAAAGTWVSLRLLPPSGLRPRPAALAGLAGRLLLQSVAAGVDVARRALDPRLPVRPGVVSHRLGLPPGAARGAFGAATSLVPGTVPAGTDASGDLLVHCLDVEAPVAAQLAADEARLARALGCADA